jgi:serine/threonine-protein kinase RsbW
VADVKPVPDDYRLGGGRVSTGFLRHARPPTEMVPAGRWVLEAFAELRLLRASLRHAVVGQPICDGAVVDGVSERMAIVATELATNAMAHAGPPTTVRLFRTEATFVVDVADNDPWLVPRFVEPRPFGAGGLGLHVARRLSLDMGWYVSHGTKCVWAQVAIPMTRPGVGGDSSQL